jgi:hypothetical protein
MTSVRSAIGKEQGYMLRVARFASLGFSFSDFAIHVRDLPDGIGIDGLRGSASCVTSTTRCDRRRAVFESIARAGRRCRASLTHTGYLAVRSTEYHGTRSLRTRAAIYPPASVAYCWNSAAGSGCSRRHTIATGLLPSDRAWCTGPR